MRLIGCLVVLLGVIGVAAATTGASGVVEEPPQVIALREEPAQVAAMKQYLAREEKRSKAFTSFCSEINSTEAINVHLARHEMGFLVSHNGFHATNTDSTNETAMYNDVPMICKWRLIPAVSTQPGGSPQSIYEDGGYDLLSFSFEGFDIPREPEEEQDYAGRPGFYCSMNFVRFYLIDKDENRQVIAEFCGKSWVPGFDIPIYRGSVVLVHVKVLEPFRGFRMYYESMPKNNRVTPRSFRIDHAEKGPDRVVLHDDSYTENELAASVFATGNVSSQSEEACNSDGGLMLKGFSGKIRYVQPYNSSVTCRWVLKPFLEPSQQLKYIKFRIPRFELERSQIPCTKNVLDLTFSDASNFTRLTTFCDVKLPQSSTWQKAETLDGMNIFFKSTTSGENPAGFEFEYYTVLMSQAFHAESLQECGRSMYRPPIVPALVNGQFLFRKKRIVGGLPARPGSWPWTAMLSFFGYQLCAATILTDRWLLTAAHCFRNERKNIIGWEVIIGKQTTDTASVVGWDYKSSALRPTIELILTHYRYGRGRNPKEFDIALVKVEQSIPFHKLAWPVCPPSAPLTGKEVCYIVGWGETNHTHTSGFLNEAQVPIIPNDECRAMNPYYSQFVTESMLCAGYRNGGVDNCRGDNGGPLLCNVNDRWELHGIISWGKGCAKKGAPGVYTRVSSYLHWIQKVINTFQ